MTLLPPLALVAIAIVAQAQTLNVLNHCSETVYLYAQSSSGTIANNVIIDATAANDMVISSNWAGSINIATGCIGTTTCQTGGYNWDGMNPFTRADFDFNSIPGKVTYDISLVYGYNVGIEITSGDPGCDAFACVISSGCPVPGPLDSCYSPCCSSADACLYGALPPGGGGCVNNTGPGPNSPFYYNSCYNAYAFPDNDGTDGSIPADFVKYTCDNTDIVITLCPEDVVSSNYTS